MYWFSILDFVSSGAGPCQDQFFVSLDNTLTGFCYRKWAPLNLTAGCNLEFDWHAVQEEGGGGVEITRQ